jgi:Fe-S oxidoreductase
VRVELNAPVDGLGSLDRLAKDAQAVFLSLDVLDLNDWPLPRDGQGRPCIPSPAQTTQRDGVFAGGLDRPDGPSPVWQASEGRWAATSMDRSLQSVSLSAGRGKETPYESRLFTSLEGVLPMPVTPAAGADGYDQAEARQEASRCLKCHCLECVKVCPYLEEFKAYPKKYVREIYNNQSIVMGVRQANKLINSCSLCGLCQAVCPGGFAMQTLCLDTRRDMVEKGKMPPSAHEFALLDMAFSLGSEFLLARHQPGQGSSAALFFPGCQLAASDPGQVRRVYEYLCAALSGGVGLMLACCGAPAHWAGRRAEMEAALAAWQKDWEALGRPPVIMACASCLDIFRQYLPQVERRSLWEVLVETDLPPGQAPVGPLAVHDPCTTRHEPGIRRHLRALLAGRGVELKELKLGGELTECCGYGGLMSIANPPLAQKVIAWRASQSERDYLAYCAVCRDRLAATGKRALHALDILFPDPAVPDPAARLGPGWSQRRENRARLKVGLLRDLWGEEAPAMAAHRALKLILAPEVAELLEKRRILIEDVQQVIYQAEHGGKKLSHPDTGRFLACFKPYKAVFWVEYSPEEEDAFRVHNAYAHRMTVKPGGSS